MRPAFRKDPCLKALGSLRDGEASIHGSAWRGRSLIHRARNHSNTKNGATSKCNVPAL